MTIVLFDKLRNREEYEFLGEYKETMTLDKKFNGVEYEITYEFHFLDKKRRPVFVEIKREIKNGQ